MSENRLLRLADELAAELSDFLTIKNEIREAQSRVTTQEPDSFELRAIGSILHDVYQNAENILQRIAKAIDQKQPVGEEWHRALLSQMTKPLTKTRPEVIQPETSTRPGGPGAGGGHLLFLATAGDAALALRSLAGTSALRPGRWPLSRGRSRVRL